MIGNKEDKRKGKLYFLNVKDGKILHKEGLVADEFDFVEGSIEKITRKDRTFNGETLPYWYVPLRDESGDLYLLGFPYSSGVFKSIVLSLASDATLGLSQKVRIETYFRDGHTKVKVFDGDRKLDWITDSLPPLGVIEIGGKAVKDDTERMNYIASLVEDINSRI